MEKRKRAGNKRKTTSETPTREEFLIVGIGASAGGIQALKEFFETVAPDSGMAYVVILHLSPDHDSRLAEVLQTVARIPVTQVKKRVTVEPNRVYVVPPNAHLTMTGGDIVVSPTISTEERRAPVDIFFRTLAESHKSRAVAVVLSGTGANGSMSLKRVKERGGACFVQNPREAEFSEMPRNSIATELVDRILNVAEIPAQIAAYRDGLGKVEIAVEAEARSADQQQALRAIFTQLRLRTGHDFSNYKRATVLRRIERRINVRHLPDLSSYADFVRENLDEINALLKDLLISVTNFFRDKAAFDYLELEVLPKIFAGKTSEDQVRIWVAGCATGEEAYSLAMLCAERTSGMIAPPEVQIFAGDIDEPAIAAARDGFYTLNDAADVSPERLRRFFTKEAGGYRVRRELREMILFANHNILKDPPFSRLDLATCRNLLIYLNGAAQERAMETFHFALNANGYLFLGNSETTDGAGDLYAPVSREHHVYQSRQIASRIAYPVAETSSRAFRFDQFNTARREPEQTRETRAGDKLFSAAELHLRLLEQFTPSIVVNHEYDIVHSSEGAAKFLQFKGGEPTRSLLKLIRSEIRIELRAALSQAVERNANVEIKNLKIKTREADEVFNIYIRPALENGDAANANFVLIIFEAARSDDAQSTVYTPAEPAAGRLEAELISSKSQLRTAVKQYEVQAEELKASNEELQAMNEEMRSATEELETSREELQSLNEELITVNQELKVKIEELSVSNSDFQNLINSTDIATIFLDRRFRVNAFTPAAARIFNLIQADYGRPLSDITHRLDYENLTADAETVLDTLHTVERETNTVDGRTFLMQMLPYRTSEDRICGVVLTFTDITSRKQAENAVRESETKYRALFTSIDEGYAVVEVLPDERGAWHDFLFLEVNPAFVEQTGMQYPVGRRATELLGTPNPHWAQIYGRVAETGEPVRFEEGEPAVGRVFDLYCFRLNGDGSRQVAVLFDDITERKQRERWQEFLLKFSDALRAETNADDAANRALLMLSEELNLDRCYIGVYRLEDDRADLTHQTGNERVPPLPGSIRLSDFPAAFQIVFDQTLVIEDFAAAEGLSDTDRQSIAALGLRALVAPCLRRGENNPLWTIVAVSALPRRWTQGEIALIEDAAERTWAAMERARAEEALRESESRLQLIADLVPDLLWDSEPDGATNWYNRRWREYTGQSFEEAVGWGWENAIHPDDRETSVRNYREAAENGATLRQEHRIRRDDGEYRWFVVNALALKDESGRIVKIYGAATDIHELRLTNETLRETENRLKLSLTGANLGTWTYNARTNEFWADERAKTMHGFAPEHPMTFEEAGSCVHPEDGERARRSFAKAIENRANLNHEFRIVMPGDAIRWICSYAEFIESDETFYGISQDVTERKQAEEAVRDSEERFRTLFDSMDEGYCIIQMLYSRSGKPVDWRYLEVNPAFEKHSKLTDVIGKTIRELAPGIEPKWMETYSRIAVTGESKRFAEHSEALRRTFDLYAFRIGEPEERKVAVLFTDITERRKIEDDLHESEARLRLAIEAGELATWEWHLEADKVLWNERHFTLFGMKPHRNPVAPAEFFNHVHPDDRERVGGLLKKAVAEKCVFDTDFRAVLDGGAAVRWMSGYGRVVEQTADGRAIRMSGVMFDIDERKQAEGLLRESEERLRLLIESAKDYAIIGINPQCEIESWNAGAEQVFGWTEREIIGKHCRVLFTPEDCAAKIPEKEIEIATREGSAEDERWHIRRDDSRFYASGRMWRITGSDGKLRGFVKITRDMSEQIKARKMQHDKEMLQKLVGAQEDERRRIARDLHDELGQQLTALRLKLDRTKKMCGDAEICTEIEGIDAMAKSIDEGVDFLAWELRPAALDQLGLIAALANYVNQWSHHSGVAAELLASSLKRKRFAPEIETNLYRIVQEALNNIHKHAKAKSVTVSLEKRGDLIVLIIEDDGAGFNLKSEKKRGRGIGLIGMRERAELVRGTLEIESTKGGGTTVFVRVPVSFAKKGDFDDE